MAPEGVAGGVLSSCREIGVRRVRRVRNPRFSAVRGWRRRARTGAGGAEAAPIVAGLGRRLGLELRATRWRIRAEWLGTAATLPRVPRVSPLVGAAVSPLVGCGVSI